MFAGGVYHPADVGGLLVGGLLVGGLLVGGLLLATPDGEKHH